MSDETHPLVSLTDEALQQMLTRAVWLVLILGAAAAAAVWIGGGWRSAAMLLTGALISAASIWEWKRMAALITARMEKKHTPGGAAGVVAFFVLKLTVFAGVLYGSLKCFRGSVVALLCGLALAALAVGWQVLRLLRD